jgi:hypothetical protein
MSAESLDERREVFADSFHRRGYWMVCLLACEPVSCWPGMAHYKYDKNTKWLIRKHGNSILGVGLPVEGS